VPAPDHLANRLTVWLARSPLHRLVSGSVMVVCYRGRRSGQPRVLPVQYAADPGDPAVLVVYPAHAERKTWWRNFSDGSDAVLVLRRVEVEAHGRVLGATDPDRAGAVAAYRARWPKVGIGEREPVVRFVVRAGPTGG
jgi:hypothetical protein